jgi:hypothetical protein
MVRRTPDAHLVRRLSYCTYVLYSWQDVWTRQETLLDYMDKLNQNIEALRTRLQSTDLISCTTFDLKTFFHPVKLLFSLQSLQNGDTKEESLEDAKLYVDPKSPYCIQNMFVQGGRFDGQTLSPQECNDPSVSYANMKVRWSSDKAKDKKHLKVPMYENFERSSIVTFVYLPIEDGQENWILHNVSFFLSR